MYFLGASGRLHNWGDPAVMYIMVSGGPGGCPGEPGFGPNPAVMNFVGGQWTPPQFPGMWREFSYQVDPIGPLALGSLALPGLVSQEAASCKACDRSSRDVMFDRGYALLPPTTEF